MAKKKKQLPDLSKHDVLTPIDVSQLGTNGDPCFGIGYDLSTKECKLCGDSELCAFKMSQNLNITRKELEQKNQYKDLDVLEDTVGIKKFIDKIIGEEQTPLHVFNCTTLVWISDIQSVQVMANEYKVYFDLSFCSGLQVRVLTYTDSRYSQHLGDIRKLFINAIGHSYLPLYESELKIGDSAIRLTEKKIDD